MKILDRILAFVFNACLLLAVAVGSVFAIASSPQYYYDQFEATGVYATVDENGVETPKVIRYIGGDKTQFARFTDEQLNEIIEHIISYLFTDQESFVLVMDGVNLNNVEQDGVNIFGDVAVTHMEDVKVLLGILGAVALICGIAGGAMIVYFILRICKGASLKLLSSTLIFYGVFVGLLVAFCVVTLVQTLSMGLGSEYFLSMAWRNFHFIIFPNPEQAMGSFFNDTLTMILSLDLFMAAVFEVLVLIGVSVVLWMIVGRIMDRISKVKQVSKEA